LPGELLLLPVQQTLPEVARFDAENIANVLEGEGPVAVGRQNPALGLAKRVLVFALAREQVLLEALHGVA
jgi:hypothetical protein